jgi:hypothetical protein
MSNTDPVPGGGPAEGDEAILAPNPNPEAVHPDFAQATPGAPAPPATTDAGSEEVSMDESDNQQ